MKKQSTGEKVATQEPHALLQGIKQLCDESDIVVSAPMGFFLAGEHSVIAGSPALLVAMPRRVFVGIRGKQKRKSASSVFRFDSLKAFDRRIDRIVPVTAKTLETYERVLSVAQSIRRARLKKIKYIPTFVNILTDGYPGRGCNYSGAFAAAFQTGLLLMNGAIKDKDIPWRGCILGDQLNNEVFQEAFNLSMIVEKLSHTHPSGYGPAFGLLDVSHQPCVYFPYVRRPSRFFEDSPNPIRHFGMMPWTVFQPQNDGEPLAEKIRIVVVDTGVFKPTAQKIGQARLISKDMAKTWEEALSKAMLTGKSPLFKSVFTNPQYAPHHALAACSTQAILTLAQYAKKADETVFKRFLSTIRCLDETLRSLGLDWPEYGQLRRLLRREIDSERIATKLTGGGGGGCVVIVGKVQDLRWVRNVIKRRYAIVFDNYLERPEPCGVKVVKKKELNEIQELRPDNLEIQCRLIKPDEDLC